MTCLEKYMQEHPDKSKELILAAMCPYWEECIGCDAVNYCDLNGGNGDCVECWNQPFPGTDPTHKTEEPHIRDSGSRQEFSTGAVRDIQKGKGRCDLMPLDVVAVLMNDGVVHALAAFKNNGDTLHLEEAVKIFMEARQWNIPTMLLEVSKHFEEGAEKYGENNWQKGLPAKCYINSGVRHYLKWLRGDKDEFHDRAFCWNVICACWTCKHRPELNDYARGKLGFNPDDLMGEYEEENE